MSKGSEVRIGSDIGGTFTDFVMVDPATGRSAVHKRLTTPDAPWRAVVEGVTDESWLPNAMLSDALMMHATTLAANTVIEGTGAVTGLLTTRGFRDVLEFRRHMRTHVFDLYGDPVAPLVPRWRRIEVTERVFSDGEVIEPLNEAEVLMAAENMASQGVTSIAVVFLHSYANPDHELRARDLIRGVTPNVDVSLSHEVLPMLGEYPRTSTTVVNAYTKPLVRGYLEELGDRLRTLSMGSLNVMTSDGALASVETAIDFPCRIIESGPAAGAILASTIARSMGLDHIVSFDMGGTTAKVCLVEEHALPLTTDLEVARGSRSMLDGFYRYRKGSGYPVAVPSADLIEIGAGGGSIASLNSLGLIQIGPESASAYPGPACYGLGGERATVTDADLVLGYLAADHFLGGRMQLDEPAARAAIDRDIAQPLGLSTEDAAWRIHDVANEMMGAAIRRQIVEKGGADLELSIVAFGGAGPVHASNLAEKLGISSIVIPPRAGVASALGLLAAPAAFHVARSKKIPVDDVDGLALMAMFKPLEFEAVSRVRQLDASGDLSIRYWLDMRYRGQGFEVRFELAPEQIAAMEPPALLEIFYRQYERRFGYHYNDIPAEIVNVHLTATAPRPSVLAAIWQVPEGDAPVPSRRKVWDPVARDWIDQEVFDRIELPAGALVRGPAVVQEDESTIVVRSGAVARVDPSGSIVITYDEKGDL